MSHCPEARQGIVSDLHYTEKWGGPATYCWPVAGCFAGDRPLNSNGDK